MLGGPVIFDRAAVRRHRDRAAAAAGRCDFLHREVAGRMADRLRDVRRSFDRALWQGAGHAAPAAGRLAIATDLSEALLRRAGRRPALVADEELLPFAGGSLDLVASCLVLHWTNDLPGALVQIRRALRPDGLFLGAMLGGDTLVELRRAFLEAETETSGGAAPRASPVAGLADAAALLQRAGFALPVADADRIAVTYPDMFALMRDLRGMGETNAAAARSRRGLRRDTLLAAAARYRDRHAGEDGRVSATFEVLWLSGWAPDGLQPRALRPGSAEARLADALGTDERPAGDKASP